MWLRKVLPRIALSFALALPAAAEAGKIENLLLHEKLSGLLPHNARWALTVIDLVTGKEIANIGREKDEQLIPGSLVKLVTTGAALDFAATRGGLNMKTAVLHDGTLAGGTLDGNIYLVGRGNPLLTGSDLKAATKEISKAGIKSITGDIIAVNTFFDTRGLERSRKGAGHVPAGALGLDFHTVAVIAAPTEPGKPSKVTVEPPNDAVRLAVEARTVAETKNTISVTQIDDTSYRVSGNITAGSAPVKQRFALQDPALYAAGVLRTSLSQAKVSVEGKARKSKAPEGAKFLAEIEGPDLQKLVRDMNVNSLNVVADNLLLLLGAERYGGPGTLEKGLTAVNDFLGSLGLSVEEAAIADGSGLSGENRVTAKYTARYLQKVADRNWFQSFRDSLPRAGMEGTLKEIGYRNEKFRAKTGNLENVTALAGYGIDKSGREIAFAFIVNTPGPLPPNARSAGDEVLRFLAE